MLADNRYGKSGIRLVKVSRRRERHEIRDLTISVQLEGEFEAAHIAGDNAAILPTDTMKNTVYALARQDPIESIESFALALTGHFVSTNPAVSSARVRIVERAWERLTVAGRPHPHAFVRPGGERRTTEVTRDHDRARVRSGLEELTVLKSAGSAFSGFVRDRFTTLPESSDRIFATAIRASWACASGEVSFELLARAIRQTLLEVFAEHLSASVQHTLHEMGEAVLDRHWEVSEIRLSLPNKHHLPVDLSPFGLDNPNEIFVATEEPFGLIEATLKR